MRGGIGILMGKRQLLQRFVAFPVIIEDLAEKRQPVMGFKGKPGMERLLPDDYGAGRRRFIGTEIQTGAGRP